MKTPDGNAASCRVQQIEPGACHAVCACRAGSFSQSVVRSLYILSALALLATTANADLIKSWSARLNDFDASPPYSASCAYPEFCDLTHLGNEASAGAGAIYGEVSARVYVNTFLAPDGQTAFHGTGSAHAEFSDIATFYGPAGDPGVVVWDVSESASCTHGCPFGPPSNLLAITFNEPISFDFFVDASGGATDDEYTANVDLQITGFQAYDCDIGTYESGGPCNQINAQITTASGYLYGGQPVPEPSSILLFGTAAAFIVGLKQRRGRLGRPRTAPGQFISGG